MPRKTKQELREDKEMEEYEDDGDEEMEDEGEEESEDEEETAPTPIVRSRGRPKKIIHEPRQSDRERLRELKEELDELQNKNLKEEFLKTLPQRITAIEKAINDDRKHLKNHHQRLNSVEANFKLLSAK